MLRVHPLYLIADKGGLAKLLKLKKLVEGETMKALSLLIALFMIQTLSSGCSSSEKSTADSDALMTKAGPAVVTKTIEYTSGNKTMKGYLAVPEGEGPFPGVLVVHEWWGQTDYPRKRAVQLAENGYMAFAVDMYGNGETVDHPKDAKKFSAKVMEDLDLAEESFRTALATLRKQDNVQVDNIAAMGYCFGGAIVLEMARRGVDLKLVASYHGNLTPLAKNEVSPMKTKMLIFNGAADPFVTKKTINSVRKNLKAANVKYKFVNYKGAKHGFTNPEATANGKKFSIPLAYDKRADHLSWDETMKAFKSVLK